VIPSDRSHLHVAATTHPGMSGKNNEDNYAVSAHWLSLEEPTPSVLAVLADGVGGHHAGEVAAEIATETISQVVLDSDASNPQEVLKNAIVQASQNVNKQALSEEKNHGMGATCACVWVIADRLYTASVGDSRIYFIRNGVIQQVTTDHTWVQEAIEHGIIQPEQARNHPRAHVIRQYLGSRKAVEPDFRLRLRPGESDQQALKNQGMILLPGDQLLLCSDGLTDLVDEHEILDALQKENLEPAVHSLVALANIRGGHDNITIVALKMPLTEGAGKWKARPPNLLGKQSRWRVVLGISIFLLAIAALSAVLFYIVSQPTASPTPTLTEMSLEINRPTEQLTQVLTPSITPSPALAATPTLTYTPWPTHTYPPQP
jgi:serine/threonine protein phosphatase PrpC